MNQNETLLHHLEHVGGITTIGAMRRYGICRLSERIRELEQDGVRICRTPRRVKTRYGNARVVIYSMEAA